MYEQFARIGKAVASPARLELLDLLCRAPRTVERLARESGMSVANTSHHLQVLRGARLVEAERDGVRMWYRLADAEVCRFFLSLRRLAESRLAELPRDRTPSRGTPRTASPSSPSSGSRAWPCR